jgi:hypothetical protein
MISHNSLDCIWGFAVKHVKPCEIGGENRGELYRPERLIDINISHVGLFVGLAGFGPATKRIQALIQLGYDYNLLGY